jgi:chromate reductase, NAD(P)H dehydrogenase (quinone)
MPSARTIQRASSKGYGHAHASTKIHVTPLQASRHTDHDTRKRTPMRILALGGSLREASRNRALLEEAAALAPTGTDLDLSQIAAAGALPLFNQDIVDRDGFPSAVVELKQSLRAADGLLIATPEYNWGIPGFLKNAIDWASRPVSDISDVFGDLPVALIGAGGQSGTRNAQNAWLPVFRYLRMRPWFDGALHIDRAGERFDDDNNLTDETAREQLRAIVAGFAEHCAQLPRHRTG